MSQALVGKMRSICGSSKPTLIKTATDQLPLGLGLDQTTVELELTGVVNRLHFAILCPLSWISPLVALGATIGTVGEQF